MENSIMETAQDGDVVTNKENRVVYSVIWILLLFLVVWPLGWFLAPIWIVLLAGEAFIPQVREVNRFLEKLLTWPRTMGYAIQEGRNEFPTPLD